MCVRLHIGFDGPPKAVMITHRVASRIQWSHLNAVKLDHRDRTLVTTSVGFGFFLGEFCSGLMKGATAVLARPGGYQDIDYLIDVIERQRITVISFVPTVLAPLPRPAQGARTGAGRESQACCFPG